MGWKGALRSMAAAQRRAEREALRKQRELERQRKQVEKMRELERAAYEVEVYENYIDLITSLHKESSSPWNWEEIFKSEPPPKPQKSSKNEKLAIQNLQNYKPSFFDKIFHRVDSKQNQFISKIEEAKKLDEELFQKAIDEYNQKYQEWERIHKLAERILAGELEAYVDIIKQVNPFSEINHLGTSLDFKPSNKSTIEINLNVKGEDVIPKEIKTLLRSGKLSIKKMPKTKFYELYQDYVCSAALRIAREIFALLPIDFALITVNADLLNTKTGLIEKQAILSVIIPKDTIKKINFDYLDPSDSMDNFVHRMNFKGTKGFLPIEKLTVDDLNV